MKSKRIDEVEKTMVLKQQDAKDYKENGAPEDLVEALHRN